MSQAVTKRLHDCFREVFPDLPEEQIEDVVRAEMPEWDSLTTLTLLTVIEEEFSVQLDEDEVAKLTSFASVRDVVGRASE